MPATDLPLVSVVLPVWNGQAFVGEAIASILAQRYPRLELLVADDGSTDATVDIVAGWARGDARVRLLRLAHRGQSAAINTAVAEARGDLIARMDHDDIAHPDRLAAQVSWLRRWNLDVCGAWARRFGTRTGVLRPAVGHEAIAYDLMFTCPILDPAALIRTEVLRRHPYSETALLIDHALWSTLAADHRLGNAPRLLLRYRMHPAQFTATGKAPVAAYQRMLRLQRFRTLHPAAGEADVALFHRIVMARSAPLDADGLVAAGAFFLRYLTPPDPEARRRMRHRWRQLFEHGVRRGQRRRGVYREVAEALVPWSGPQGQLGAAR
jgi:glycosyltransferase involved in cell wall biosynthesis